MKIAILSSFPPKRCGVGQYAEQQAQMFEEEGHEVDRIEVDAVNEARTFSDRRGIIRRAAQADKLVVHYQPGLYFGNPASQNGILKAIVPIRIVASMCSVARECTVVVHENFTPIWPEFAFVQKSATSKLFKKASGLFFHTTSEMRQFEAAGFVAKEKSVLRPSAFYRKKVTTSQEKARDMLGLNRDGKIFLCIGFCHRGKGFVEFAKEFSRLHDTGAIPRSTALYVVTSVRDPDPKSEDHLKRLVAMNGQSGVTVHTAYVGDETFDLWIVAADVVVAPYRYGATSGPIARASLYGKRCLVSNLEGLKEQVAEYHGAVTYDPESEQSLDEAVKELAQ